MRSGALTPRLFSLEEGYRLWLGPLVAGSFTLDDVPEDKRVVLVSTGTGLAPYMSMLRSVLLRGVPRQVAVLHGANHSWDLGYRGELMTLERTCSQFTYLPIVGQLDKSRDTWAGAVGRVQDLWIGGALVNAWGITPTPDDTHIFLCGNPSMIDDVLILLAESGFYEHGPDRPGTVYVERYW